MIIIIDNYDSFTFNLVQYIGEFGYSIKALRNDQASINTVEKMNPSHIVISPGPGCPEEAGVSLDLIQYFAPKLPILGVCLGHQSIGHVYGCKIKKLKKPMHGKISRIYHNQQALFKDIPNPFNAARYHSLALDRGSMPKTLRVTAQTADGLIMGCQHIQHSNVQGVQFHPESLWTEYGKKIIENFLTS